MLRPQHSQQTRKKATLSWTTIRNSVTLNTSSGLQSQATDNRTAMSPPAANSTMMNPQPEKKVFVGLAYIPKLTEQITKHIPNLCAAPRPLNKVGNLFTNMKEKLRVGQNSMVVYDIPCAGCHETRCYLGETTWNLNDRCGPPGGHTRNQKNIEKNPRATALVHHVATTQHQFEFADKRILKKVRHKGILKIHETNQILLHEGYAVNFKKDAEHVSPMFYNLLAK